MMKTVELQIYDQDGNYGLTISRLTGERGEGFRVFGPKLCGDDKVLRTKKLSIEDIDKLIQELETSREFLQPLRIVEEPK